ncbi:MAG: DNA methyltransferase [Actinomycetia bacterium]|nr:DNA methyltransferase [Actinomycetes bacterium]MCP4962215.1 DNA methyltransferase [Actinomycetes bacterium]
MPSDFETVVKGVVESLEPGTIMTYGEVAAEAGRPRAARAVGMILAKGGIDGWWRVVNSAGRLVPGLESEHLRRLNAEGVGTRNGKVVMRGR